MPFPGGAAVTSLNFICLSSEQNLIATCFSLSRDVFMPYVAPHDVYFAKYIRDIPCHTFHAPCIASFLVWACATSFPAFIVFQAPFFALSLVSHLGKPIWQPCSTMRAWLQWFCMYLSASFVTCFGPFSFSLRSLLFAMTIGERCQWCHRPVCLLAGSLAHKTALHSLTLNFHFMTQTHLQDLRYIVHIPLNMRSPQSRISRLSAHFSLFFSVVLLLFCKLLLSQCMAHRPAYILQLACPRGPCVPSSEFNHAINIQKGGMPKKFRFMLSLSSGEECGAARCTALTLNPGAAM